MAATSNEGQSQVTLTAYHKTNSTLYLAGTFHAEVTRASESRDIDGTLDVTFPAKKPGATLHPGEWR